MCSFIITNFQIENLDYINFYNKRRGPDYTSVHESNGVTFVHNLLSITGEFKKQPFVDGNIVCLYNGEIYNYKDFGFKALSDGEVLIPLYKKYGKDFLKHIDGEFAVVLYDFQSKEIIAGTDVFATKPLWFGNIDDSRYCISSYESVLKRSGAKDTRKLEANKTIVWEMDTFKIKHSQENKKFDISNQYKTSYDDCLHSFSSSIQKRSKDLREKIFIGLSSGYDSGTIACALMNHGVDFKSYSIRAQENLDIIDERHRILLEHQQEVEKIFLTKEQFSNEKKHIKEFCEEFLYQIKRGAKVTPNEYMTNDKGAIGLAFICSVAKSEGIKIYFSGQGADEIFSDYGYAGRKIYNHSTFGGKYPNDLREVFPWNSFYQSTQLSYLAKEENISGCYGIEGRYPFLDFDLVQEFLWLSPELKNKNYKSVLYEYMKTNCFPFEENKKIGFSCDVGLR